MALKRAVEISERRDAKLSTLSTDPPSQLDVLGHDGDSLGVDSAEIGVFEKTYEISFTSLLKSHNSGALEPQVSLKVLSDLTDEPLEGEFPDEKLSALLVTPDFTKSDRSRPVSMRLLDTSCGGSTLPGCFGGELFPRSLATSGLPSCLLRTGHACLSSEKILRPVRCILYIYSVLEGKRCVCWGGSRYCKNR